MSQEPAIVTGKELRAQAAVERNKLIEEAYLRIVTAENEIKRLRGLIQTLKDQGSSGGSIGEDS